VVQGGKIVGRGRNRVLARRDPTAHAEIEAIREAAARLGTHDLTGATVYATCEPCPMCLFALAWARVARLVYAADREDAAAAGFDDRAFAADLAAGQTPGGMEVRRLALPAAREVMAAWAMRPGRRLY
jgi:guanine deaminase